MLDACLVVLAWSEQIGEATGMSGNMSYLRSMRLLKIAKALRLFRLMRTFRELRFLLDSIVVSVNTLLWTILVMLGTTLIFALIFVQAALTSDDPQAAEGEHWTSIGAGMLHLFMAITGGVDWVALLDPLWVLGWVYVLAFVMYVTFQVFVVSNAIQSLFVQRLLNYWAKDEHREVALRIEQFCASSGMPRQQLGRHEHLPCRCSPSSRTRRGPNRCPVLMELERFNICQAKAAERSWDDKTLGEHSHGGER